MDTPKNADSTDNSGRRLNLGLLAWGALLIAWFVVLCVVPDPRPLGAPDKVVGGLRATLGLSEPAARAVATVVLRGVGLGLIGILLALVVRSLRARWSAPLVLVAAPLLAVLAQWINYGYFPIAPQILFGVTCALLGGLAGLALQRSRRALLPLVALVILAAGILAWGTSTDLSDDLYESARATGLYILANAKSVPDGDDGFARLMEEAFVFAEDNSHGTDGVQPNKAAILALGVILGEEKVARVAKRRVDLSRSAEIAALRNRVTLQGRNDLARHFWVSAALTVLSDGRRSMTVGITKELMDATPGGSGFSFVDLLADRSGTLLAEAATRNAESAQVLQLRIRNGVRIADFCPDIDGLPEGLSRDEFQTEYGGLGGARTQAIVVEIQQRLATCLAFR